MKPHSIFAIDMLDVIRQYLPRLSIIICQGYEGRSCLCDLQPIHAMNNLTRESRILNIRYDLPAEILERLSGVYERMDGWLGYGNGVNGEDARVQGG